MLIELKSETDLVELFRLLSPEQQAMILNLMQGLVGKPVAAE